MIIEDPDKKKELDKIPDVDEKGDPIYKIDEVNEETATEKPDLGYSSSMEDESQFKDTPQDLKDINSQE